MQLFGKSQMGNGRKAKLAKRRSVWKGPMPGEKSKNGGRKILWDLPGGTGQRIVMGEKKNTPQLSRGG